MSVNNSALTLSERLKQYALLMRLDKPVGILLLLWPTLWALWLAADGIPHIAVLVVFTTGVLLMRSAGCVINDYADRDIDGHVQRTQNRPLAQGKIPPKEALLLFVTLCLTAFAMVLTMNWLTIALSFGGALLAAIYPFMKRYTHLPQVVLGAAFAWSIPMGFAAQTGTVEPIAWVLFFISLMWTVAYDTMYAMVDREDDLKIGVKSTAILFGDADRVIIGLLQALTLAGLFVVGQHQGLGVFYYSGLAVGTALAIYQQTLIRNRERQQCFKAFLNNNWFGAIVFAGIALNYFSL
ncbi:MAG: 4-hydroxybenzoate octaprenyltransferase [Gammaproteobacteria bacterium]|nr:4-hydroxybenzoate octaprenyltransferase [Gammaproteobacteria bacterium]